MVELKYRALGVPCDVIDLNADLSSGQLRRVITRWGLSPGVCPYASEGQGLVRSGRNSKFALDPLVRVIDESVALASVPGCPLIGSRVFVDDGVFWISGVDGLFSVCDSLGSALVVLGFDLKESALFVTGLSRPLVLPSVRCWDFVAGCIVCRSVGWVEPSAPFRHLGVQRAFDGLRDQGVAPRLVSLISQLARLRCSFKEWSTASNMFLGGRLNFAPFCNVLPIAELHALSRSLAVAAARSCRLPSTVSPAAVFSPTSRGGLCIVSPVALLASAVCRELLVGLNSGDAVSDVLVFFWNELQSGVSFSGGVLECAVSWLAGYGLYIRSGLEPFVSRTLDVLSEAFAVGDGSVPLWGSWNKKAASSFARRARFSSVGSLARPIRRIFSSHPPDEFGVGVFPADVSRFSAELLALGVSLLGFFGAVVEAVSQHRCDWRCEWSMAHGTSAPPFFPGWDLVASVLDSRPSSSDLFLPKGVLGGSDGGVDTLTGRASFACAVSLPSDLDSSGRVVYSLAPRVPFFLGHRVACSFDVELRGLIRVLVVLGRSSSDPVLLDALSVIERLRTIRQSSFRRMLRGSCVPWEFRLRRIVLSLRGSRRSSWRALSVGCESSWVRSSDSRVFLDALPHRPLVWIRSHQSGGCPSPNRFAWDLNRTCDSLCDDVMASPGSVHRLRYLFGGPRFFLSCDGSMAVSGAGSFVRRRSASQAAAHWSSCRVQGVAARCADELSPRCLDLGLFSSGDAFGTWFDLLTLPSGHSRSADWASIAFKIRVGIGGCWTQQLKFCRDACSLAKWWAGDGGLPEGRVSVEDCPLVGCGGGRCDRRHVHLGCTSPGVLAARRIALQLVTDWFRQFPGGCDWASAPCAPGGFSFSPSHLQLEFPEALHFGFLCVPSREASGGFVESPFDLSYRGLASRSVGSSLSKIGATHDMVDDLVRRLVVGSAVVRAAFGSSCRSVLDSLLSSIPPSLVVARPAPSGGHVVCEGFLCSRRAAVGAVPRLSSGSRECGPRCAKCYRVSHGLVFSRALRLRLGKNISMRRSLAFSVLDFGSFVSRFGRDIFGRARPAAGAVEFALRASGLAFKHGLRVWVLSSCHIWSECSCGLSPQLGLEAVRSVCPACWGIRVKPSAIGGSCGSCGLSGVSAVCAACAVSFHVSGRCLGLCAPPARMNGLWLCPECVVLAAGVVSTFNFDSGSLCWADTCEDHATSISFPQSPVPPPRQYPVQASPPA